MQPPPTLPLTPATIFPPLVTVTMLAAGVTRICPPMYGIHAPCLLAFVGVAMAALWGTLFAKQVRWAALLTGACVGMYLASQWITSIGFLGSLLVGVAFGVGLIHWVRQRRVGGNLVKT
jgi:hypothetical protein